MKKPGRKKTALTLLIAVTAVLLGLYVFSIGKYYTEPPSEGMSRGIRICESGMPALSVPSPDQQSLYIIAADGNLTRVYHVGSTGIIIDEIELNLDLSGASDISGYMSQESELILITGFSDQKSITRCTVNLRNGNWNMDTPADNYRSFDCAGRNLIVEKDSGLFFTDSPTGRPEKLIIPGRVKYFAADSREDDLTVVSVVEKSYDTVDILLTQSRGVYEDMETSAVMLNSTDPAYRRLNDISSDGETVTLLFVMRDNRYGLNYITILRIARDTGEPVGLFQVHVPIQNSSYKLVESTSDSASFVLQARTSYGYNLVKCRISGTGETTYTDLTKTRPLSIPSAFLKTDGWNSLVFSDVEDEHFSVLYASENPALLSVSTRLNRDDVLRIAGAVVANSVLAFSLGAIYMLTVPLLPFGMVLLLSGRIGRTPARKKLICGTGAFVNTVLKLAVVYYLINRTGNYTISAPFFGEEPLIYIVIILITALSYVLILGDAGSSSAEGRTVSGLFFRFLLVDTIQLTLVFSIYLVTGMMLGKF